MSVEPQVEDGAQLLDADWYTALLEEYRSLRTEALTARDAQQSILRVAVPLLAALIGLGATVALREDSLAGGLLLALSVPLVVGLTFEMWAAEVQRSVRAGSVVAAIEQRLGVLFDGNAHGYPMGWELWLRRKPNREDGEKPALSAQQEVSVSSAKVIFAFLIFVALISLALSFYFLAKHGFGEVMVPTAVSILTLAYVVRRPRSVAKGIERLNEVPEVHEVWPGATAR